MTHSKRSCTDSIVLSTLPHLASILFFLGCPTTSAIIYCLIILVSSSLSIIWHIHHEPNNYIFMLDYAFAIAWNAADIVITYDTTNSVLFLNSIIFTTNQITDYLANRHIITYENGHTLWHVLSFSKSIIVASIVRNMTDICSPPRMS
jgi:hypothetical protein